MDAKVVAPREASGCVAVAATQMTAGETEKKVASSDVQTLTLEGNEYLGEVAFEHSASL
jgi:hypothetical protein